MAQESAFDITGVDDFYFSALFDETPGAIFPISDVKYAEELQFQEALVSSAVISQTTNTNPSFPQPSSSSSSSAASSSSSFLVSSSSALAITIQVLKPIEDHEGGASEIEESSQFYCEICAESKPIEEIFKSERCAHSFCCDCITKHVAIKVQDRIDVISCPGLDCRGVHVLELEACRPILPREVLERWDDALCEALLMASAKFYCPFQDCSALLLNDNEGEEEAETIMQSECPLCHRLFCAQCYVPWHPGIGCDEFQRLSEDERGREDLMVRELAKEKEWGRCPRCRYYVERIEGCLHITCRCLYQFCYRCGSEWTPTHGSCQRN